MGVWYEADQHKPQRLWFGWAAQLLSAQECDTASQNVDISTPSKGSNLKKVVPQESI